jgi:hypothetical protein
VRKGLSHPRSQRVRDEFVSQIKRRQGSAELVKTGHNSDILGLFVLADLLRSRSGVAAQTT